MRLKEFLSVRAIEFQSINILDDADGLAELRRLGARSIPILSRGDKFVFAQNIAHVVKFLGLNEAAGPVLSPDQLADRIDRYLSAAERFIPQMPDDRLSIEVPNRPRTYRVLGHHLFRIPDAFLDAVAGQMLTYEMLTQPPPETLRTSQDIADYGGVVRQRFARWWSEKADKTGRETVPTYYGPQSLHEIMERTTWHSGQHVRQWMMLLRMAGIEPDRPLADSDFTSLPMPKEVWDG